MSGIELTKIICVSLFYFVLLYFLFDIFVLFYINFISFINLGEGVWICICHP